MYGKKTSKIKALRLDKSINFKTEIKILGIKQKSKKRG